MTKNNEQNPPKLPLEELLDDGTDAKKPKKPSDGGTDSGKPVSDGGTDSKKSKKTKSRDMLSPSYSVRESKRKVRGLEERNCSAIILWRSNDRWWKMCDNSALIYYYHVAPMIEREPKIHIDTDRYFNSEVGTISILAEDLPQMETLLAEHGIERSPHSDDFITSFTLPKPLTPEEVKSFFAREQGARDKVNEILRGENLEQFLDAEMRKTISILYHITRKMDDHRRWFVGQSMTETILDLYMLKNQMERKTLEKVVAAEEMREQIDRLMTYTNVLLEMRILDVHKVEGLAKHLYNMRTECNRIMAEGGKKE